MGMVELSEMVEKARQVVMTPSQREQQRQSFAYGNSKIENSHVTRISVEKESEALAKENGTPHDIG